MLVMMFYMVIIPLYKLVETTVTWQISDLGRVPDAVVGEFTAFPLDQDADRYLWQDLHLHPSAAFDDHRHRHGCAFAIDRWIAGLAGGPHRYARQETGQSTGGAALHHAFLDSGPGLAGAVQEQDYRWSTGDV